VYGSSGASTFVATEPIDSHRALDGDWRNVTGPWIEADYIDGEMPEIDLLLLSIRFPAEMLVTKAPIIQQLERDAAVGQSRN
jgi:hypothetical protein